MVQMETDSPVVYHGTSESRFPPDGISKGQPQLTKEDLRVLRECNRESFYYRCLPFAFAGMAATYLAFRRGLLTGHPKFGPAAKMTAAAFTGWILGKASYRSKCEEKFLNVKNSTIGDMVRKKRGYTLETFGGESQFSDEEDLSLKDHYTSSSGGDYHSSSGSLNFDKNNPVSELEDRNRPTVDSEGGSNFSGESMTNKRFTTYDELRMKNREEYEKQFRQPEIPRTDTYRQPWNQLDTPKRSSLDSQNTPLPKNAYGDSWDNPKFS